MFPVIDFAACGECFPIDRSHKFSLSVYEAGVVVPLQVAVTREGNGYCGTVTELTNATCAWIFIGSCRIHSLSLQDVPIARTADYATARLPGNTKGGVFITLFPLSPLVFLQSLQLSLFSVFSISFSLSFRSRSCDWRFDSNQSHELCNTRLSGFRCCCSSRVFFVRRIALCCFTIARSVVWRCRWCWLSCPRSCGSQQHHFSFSCGPCW